MLADPAWLTIARKYLGTKEIKGRKHNQLIVGWWARLKADFRDDETPWCGAFVGAVMLEAGFDPPRNAASARAWLKFGKVLDRPAVGAIVVFWRGRRDGTSGHVGIIAGKDRFGHLMVIGGNQGDMVSLKPFDDGRVLGFRWPSVWPYEERFHLPVLASDGRVSTNEA